MPADETSRATSQRRRPAGGNSGGVTGESGGNGPARLRVTYRAPAAIRPNPRNARTHDAAQLRQLRESIRQFGFVNPVLVDEAGMLIAGHGRLAAATELGLDRVPTIQIDGLTEQQKRQLVLADNRIALNAAWDKDLLAIELRDLQSADTDLGLLGFDTRELRYLLPPDSGEADDQVPPPPETPRSKRGDLWTLGAHRVLCGDATARIDVERALDGKPADACFTDPPYNVDYANTMKDKLRGKHRPIANDDLSDEKFAALLRGACSHITALTNGAIYICMSSSELHTLQRAFLDAGGHWSTFIIWAKSRFTIGRSDYQRQYEPILYGWREGAKRFWIGVRDQGDVWNFDTPHASDLHPTMKPVALVERALKNSAPPGGLVLDPFGGSGTTLIAAEKLGLRAALVEISPAYVDVIVRRWEEFTGGRAVMEAAGKGSRRREPSPPAGEAAQATA